MKSEAGFLEESPGLQSNLGKARRRAGPDRRLRVGEQAIAPGSDLSADREIAAEELDAIARLPGNDPCNSAPMG